MRKGGAQAPPFFWEEGERFRDAMAVSYGGSIRRKVTLAMVDRYAVFGMAAIGVRPALAIVQSQQCVAVQSSAGSEATPPGCR
jgi:hypothetical protein